jgi:hypothetical protein
MHLEPLFYRGIHNKRIILQARYVFKGVIVVSQVLFIIGASIFGVLGLVHLIYTFLPISLIRITLM